MASQFAVGVEEVLVEPSLLLACGRQIIIVPLVVARNSPHPNILTERTVGGWDTEDRQGVVSGPLAYPRSVGYSGCRSVRVYSVLLDMCSVVKGEYLRLSGALLAVAAVAGSVLVPTIVAEAPAGAAPAANAAVQELNSLKVKGACPEDRV